MSIGGFELDFWTVLGGALLLWALHDLIVGHTWAHRKVIRSEDPWVYWPILSVWVLIAVWLLGFLPVGV